MTCAQGLLRLLWGGARSWSATGLRIMHPTFHVATSFVLQLEVISLVSFLVLDFWSQNQFDVLLCSSSDCFVVIIEHR